MTASKNLSDDISHTVAVVQEEQITKAKIFRFVKKYDLAVFGSVVFIIILFLTVFANVLSPYDPTERDLRNRLSPPTAQNWFGTDELGRDVLTRVLYGGRTVLVAGFISLAISLVFGMAFGMLGAYWGGLVESLIMRLMDIMLSFPSVLLAILIVTTLGVGQENLIIAIGFALVPVFARLVRSIVVTLINEEYVLASRALGATDIEIIRRHIFPNMIPPVLVQASALLAIAISTATALNFLGLGVETGVPDWGMMVADGQKLMFDAPHVPLFPGLAITITVLSVNFIGDGLRDALDPRLRNRG